jgi:hypothetical protein
MKIVKNMTQSRIVRARRERRLSILSSAAWAQESPFMIFMCFMVEQSGSWCLGDLVVERTSTWR